MLNCLQKRKQISNEILQKRVVRLHSYKALYRQSLAASQEIPAPVHCNQSNGKLIQSRKKRLSAKKQAADFESKIAGKVADLSRNLKNLNKAEEHELMKQEVESKKRRDEELRHARTVTRETERQVQLQTQLKGIRLIIDLAKLPKVIKVLFIASNPIDQTQLILDEEL